MADVGEDVKEKVDILLLWHRGYEDMLHGMNRISKICSAFAYRPDLIHVKHCLGGVAHHKDQDYGGENRGHGGVTAVCIAAHKARMVCMSTGDCTEDETVEN